MHAGQKVPWLFADALRVPDSGVLVLSREGRAVQQLAGDIASTRQSHTSPERGGARAQRRPGQQCAEPGAARRIRRVDDDPIDAAD